MPYELLLGGVRAGKSRLAERIAAASGATVAVVATATAGDAEMAARIAAHRRSRPPAWSVVEEPVDLVGAVASLDPAATVVVDCLTLWVSNLLDGPAGGDVDGEAARAADLLANRPGWGVVVSNEVGSGIVPATPLARRYGDVLGRVNALFADGARRARLVVAGKTLDLLDP